MSLQLDDVYRLRTSSDARVSPDGRWVVCTVSRALREEDRYASNLWLMPAEGGEARPITQGAARDHSPRWSPDGREITFISDRDGDPRLYVLPLAAGGEAIALARLPGPASDPGWAPDGSAIAALARVGPKRGEAEPFVADRIKYKSDGVGLLHGQRHIFVVPRDGSPARQVTDGDWDDNPPSWSPDGRRLAFASARHATRDQDQGAAIWVVPADGGEPACLVPPRGPAFTPRWSPDGRRLAFVGHDHPMAGSGLQARLWVVPADGGEAVNVSAGLDNGVAKPPYFAYAPMWASDDEVLAGVVDGGNVHLWSFPAAGGRPVQQVAGEFTLPDADLHRPSGRIVATRSDWQTPGDVWLFEQGSTRRLTRLNPWLEEAGLPRPERRQFATADAQRVDGWLYSPEGARRPLPLVVDVHGGPHNAWGSGFFAGLYWQELVAAGCCVLALNPRGSAGYGQAWLEAARGRWGEADLPDLLAAVEALIGEGLVDRERVGICGYSYGGYMTNYAITHSPLFRAAVSGGGIANLVSFYGTSDIGPFFTGWEIADSFQEDLERYVRLSAVFAAARATAPTLLLHGERDDRVPISQSEEMLVALRRLGKSAELVRYPGASHGFRGPTGRPSHRVDYGRRLVEWMQRHLIAAAGD